MGNPAFHVAEFARRHDIDYGGLNRGTHYLPGADLFLRPLPGIAPIIEKVSGTFLMNDVEKRAAHDQERHDNDICLHDGGWYGRR
jgi:hypothetical protein